MKIKTIYSETKDNVSIAKVQTKDGIFVGKAKCHPDDDFSNFLGCQIAELRAGQKAMHVRSVKLKEKIKILNSLCNMLCKEDLYRINKIIKETKKEIDFLESRIEITNSIITNMLNKREKFKEMITNKRKIKND